MKLLIMLLILGLVGCSSTSKRHGGVGNLAEEDQMIGDELPEWIDNEGVDSGYIYAVGEAEFSAEKSIQLAKEAAQHNAKMRITERMPSDYKVVAQRTLSSVSSGEFNKIEITKGDLYGLTDVTVSRRFITCRKIIRNTKFDKKVNRICFARARVPVSSFNSALARTVKSKFGEDVGTKFSDVLKKQVEQEFLK